MGLSEQRYVERLSQALRQEGAGLVEPQTKTAMRFGSGRSTGFLTEDQPTLRAATKGALIGGSLGQIAGTALGLATHKRYGPTTQLFRSSAKSLGAPIGATIGAGIGSYRQRRSGHLSHDEPVLRGAALAGASLGALSGIKSLGTKNPGAVALRAAMGAVAGATSAGTGLTLARAAGRHRKGLPREPKPRVGPVGEVLGGAALGAGLGRALATRHAAKLHVAATHDPVVKMQLQKLFSNRPWTEAGHVLSPARRAAKASTQAMRVGIRNKKAWHYRPLEQRGALIGTAAGVGLALGLLAVSAHRRKNRKTQDERKS